MKGMILAAGRGTRMGHSKFPKPLTPIEGKMLIEYRIEAFVQAGITDIVINVYHMADKIQAALGDGSRYGAQINYSVEETLLNTGGGIYQALPLLGDAPFIVVNADVWTDYPLTQLVLPPSALAHVVLVPNPAHHPQGDFTLAQGRVGGAGPRYTFSGVSCLHPRFFADSPRSAFGLGDWLVTQSQKGVVTGELYTGTWADVGTPERLAWVEECLQTKTAVHEARPRGTAWH